MYRSLLSRLENCKFLLKSSSKDLSSINKYQKNASNEDLTLRMSFLIKELDKTFLDLESRYKEEKRKVRKESKEEKRKVRKERESK